MPENLYSVSKFDIQWACVSDQQMNILLIFDWQWEPISLLWLVSMKFDPRQNGIMGSSCFLIKPSLPTANLYVMKTTAIAIFSYRWTEHQFQLSEYYPYYYYQISCDMLYTIRIVNCFILKSWEIYLNSDFWAFGKPQSLWLDEKLW